MVHKDASDVESGPQIRQVEFNTIASSFGGLAAKVSKLHRQGSCNPQYLTLLDLIAFVVIYIPFQPTRRLFHVSSLEALSPLIRP